jgi:hypothetical protein
VPPEYKLPHGWNLPTPATLSLRRRRVRSSVPSSWSDEHSYRRHNVTNRCGL